MKLFTLSEILIQFGTRSPIKTFTLHLFYIFGINHFYLKTFPNYRQPDTMDCGPTCLRIIAKYYGKNFTLQRLREISGINREGVSLLGISRAAEKINLRTSGARVSIDELRRITLPAIIHWKQSHFVVLYLIKKGKYYISDPSLGLVRYDEGEFLKYWTGIARDDGNEGIVLTISTTPEFYAQQGDTPDGLTFSYLFGYLRTHRQLIIQLCVGLGVGSLLQLMIPFLTQSIVDTGINTKNLNFIVIILIAQAMLLIGRISVEFIRSWILLHVSTRVNISILTDFVIKLMKLPMAFFDAKMTGDIMQRMDDQRRIENFLTGPTINVAFSLFNLILFAVVLSLYDSGIFLIFIFSSILYTIWVILFLKRRRKLDYFRFDIGSKNHSAVVQLITGMQEIKLNNCEQQKRWEWEQLQATLFRFSIKSLTLGQVQQAGTFLINEGKNILITYVVAKSVIDGELTLGSMMAVQYIVGQLNAPIEQMITFLQQFQDTKISLERLNEIHEMDEEESPEKLYTEELPHDRTIKFENVYFSYPGRGTTPVLADINLTIPHGKTTAIVGMSGSGKTTILKLLLRFYDMNRGDIKVGSLSLNQISFRLWRDECGTVMQDGFIFSDTIARNIAVGDERINFSKLSKAIQVANIADFVESLPLGLNTKLGAEGNGISQGQRQRILIARAVYKNPEYIFFDEATNALDANNEKQIMENLESFLIGKTVVIVAHRLSTVRKADNIIVIKSGQIIEQGSHKDLISLKGEYFKLVQNQLELEN